MKRRGFIYGLAVAPLALLGIKPKPKSDFIAVPNEVLEEFGLPAVDGVGIREAMSLLQAQTVEKLCLSKPTFLVFFYLNVGNLAPNKAKMFCDRVGSELRSKKPHECLNFFIIPQRDYATWVEVIPLNGGKPSEAIENFVYTIGE